MIKVEQNPQVEAHQYRFSVEEIVHASYVDQLVGIGGWMDMDRTFKFLLEEGYKGIYQDEYAHLPLQQREIVDAKAAEKLAREGGLLKMVPLLKTSDRRLGAGVLRRYRSEHGELYYHNDAPISQLLTMFDRVEGWTDRVQRSGLWQAAAFDAGKLESYKVRGLFFGDRPFFYDDPNTMPPIFWGFDKRGYDPRSPNAIEKVQQIIDQKVADCCRLQRELTERINIPTISTTQLTPQGF
ncbi:hypothetical protein HYT02_03555 [Candidatus Gottesmanbacteria bacterium]|nr:hypothetical protein [Candidatus Gottesmanbacteria bacterium]